MVIVFMEVGFVFSNVFVMLIYGMFCLIGVLFYVFYGILNVMLFLVVFEFIKEVVIDLLVKIGYLIYSELKLLNKEELVDVVIEKIK